MNRIDVLNNLQQRNNSLKSILIHEQIKYDNYSFDYFQKYSSILREYRKHKSLYKSSLIVGINYEDVMNWYIQGQLNNPIFKEFSTSINKINEGNVEKDNSNNENEECHQILNKDIGEGTYKISQYGDGWSYKTFIDGEKIFIISNDLENLKKKVKSKHLPLD